MLRRRMVEGEGLLAALALQASVTAFRCSMLRIVEPDEASHLPLIRVLVKNCFNVGV